MIRAEIRFIKNSATIAKITNNLFGDFTFVKRLWPIVYQTMEQSRQIRLIPAITRPGQSSARE